MKKKYSYRLKTSYGAYKRMIREAEDKGYEIKKDEIMTKKQFDYEYSQYKQRGDTNITRKIFSSIPSYQYGIFNKRIRGYLSKGYKVDLSIYGENDVHDMNYEDFKSYLRELIKISSSRKEGNLLAKRFNKSFGEEIAEGTLMFAPSFTEDYAPEMIREFVKDNPELYKKYFRKKVPLPTMSEEVEYMDVFSVSLDRKSVV